MKILLDMQGSQADKSLRGIGRYTVAMAQAIIQQRRGHDIHLLFNGAYTESFKQLYSIFSPLLPQENIHVYQPVYQAARGYVKTKWRVLADNCLREAFIAAIKPDLIHIMSFFVTPDSDISISIRTIGSGPLTVVTVHDLIPSALPHMYLINNPRIARSYNQRLEELKKADAWLTVSDYTSQDCINRLGLDSDWIMNASEGCEDIFRPIVTQSDNKKNGEYIFYVGGFDPRKNVELLIKAYAKIDSSLREGLYLLIGGHILPELKIKLKSLGKSCGLDEKSLVFSGYVTDEDLVRLYNGCRLFVYPSVYEGFGLPVLEAMRCGAPTIAANATSLPEVIGNEDALFDPFSIDSICNKMTEVLANESFRQKLINKGLERSGNFSWERAADKAIGLFERVYSVKHNNALQENHDVLSSLITHLKSLGIKPKNKDLIMLAHGIDRMRLCEMPLD